jgi:hypothetical protein
VSTATANAVTETRTSEVAMNVTREQIDNLPQQDRNFLNFAGLAPGITVSRSETNKQISAGGLNASKINVFVDGASYKNDIITGGVVGQDASRGNPFPRSALQEFRVITNNYRAEYQKASSAIITAVTRSGGNTWKGGAFADVQNETFVARDTFARASNATRPEYSRYLFGVSAGGPIQKDRLFFFGSYEGNVQNREGRTVLGGNVSTLPAAAQAVNNELHTSPFRQHLGFGKLTFVPNERDQWELSTDIRHETDIRGFGGQFGDAWRSYSAANNQRNNVYTGRLKNTRSMARGTNEALVSYQMFQWNQDPLNFDTPGQVVWGSYWIGGSDGRQDLKQHRVSLRDDFSYSGFQWAGDHVVKVGANYDFTRYDMNKQNNENPLFEFSSSNNYASPVLATYGVGNGQIKQNNNQFGIYAQDTWNPSRQLTIDAGLRWDVETGMFQRDYVTPQSVVDSITALAPSLYIPITAEKYFSNGSNRDLFLGAWQPRVGASYLLTESGRTAVFASYGIFYDRLEFNATFDESYRRQHPIYRIPFNNSGNPGTFAWNSSYFSREGLDALINSATPPASEIFLIPNDLQPPKSNQMSVGIRHAMFGFTGSLTYNRTRSDNGFSFEWANVNYDQARQDCCISVPTGGFQNILVGNNTVRTWYDAFLVQLDRPYTRVYRSWGFGAGVAYTLAKAEQEGNDLFSFPQVRAYGNTRHPIGDDRRHQVVANWITDVPYLWGIQFSGIAQVASGLPRNRVQFVPLASGGNQRQFLSRSRGPWYHNVDFRLRKDFVNLGGNRAGVTASLFNVFNTQNLGCYNETYATPGATAGTVVLNNDYLRSGCTISDPRRLQVGMTYDF